MVILFFPFVLTYGLTKLWKSQQSVRMKWIVTGAIAGVWIILFIVSANQQPPPPH
jgi:hypothetical protein